MRQAFGDLGRLAAQIAGLVEPIGQLARDQAPGRIDEGEGDLLAHMVAQRDRGCGHVLHVEDV